ncbi:MAG TPA: hypothetical protein VJI33_04795 [Candidatus Paceibacterota bacterium]
MKNFFAWVVVIATIVLLTCGTAIINNKRMMKRYAGYPAVSSQLTENKTYEMLAQWQSNSNFITLLRESDGRFRLFGFNEVFTPGFYKASGTNLYPLIQTPLYQVSGTNPPTAYGETK